MMSVEKCSALYFPFKSRNICTVRTAKWATGISCVVYFAINFFWFFVVKQQKGDVGARNVTCVYENFFAQFVLLYSKIDGVLYSFGPFAIMGLTNIAVIYKFVQAKLASKHGETESTNQALSNATMRGTAILITVTMIFIVLTGPANIILATAVFVDIHPLLVSFLYIGVALNHSINGLLYTIVGSKFRKELIDMLRCTGGLNHTDVGRNSPSSSNLNKITETTSP